jgi:hypothetical protein
VCNEPNARNGDKEVPKKSHMKSKLAALEGAPTFTGLYICKIHLMNMTNSQISCPMFNKSGVAPQTVKPQKDPKICTKKIKFTY